MARPRLKFDETTVALMGEIGMTWSEMADRFQVSRTTIGERMAKGQPYRIAYDHGKARLIEDLRRAQIEKAVKDKNPMLLIWLGKNLLGQADKIEQETTHRGEGGIRILYDDNHRERRDDVKGEKEPARRFPPQRVAVEGAAKVVDEVEGASPTSQVEGAAEVVDEEE
jgi:hypothetical protein